MAWKSRSEEWSRPPEPSPDASGMLVQLLRAATECEFDLVPEPGQVMQKGLDLGSRTATKGGTHDAVIMNLTPKCPCEGVMILELREFMCRWPLGDPTTPEFRYCGTQALMGLPYCPHHAQIAYQPAAERKRLGSVRARATASGRRGFG